MTVSGVFAPSSVQTVQIPMWCADNQSDIVWYTAIKEAENRFSIINYKPINPPITGGRGIDRFLILGAAVTISGLMITVHLVLQRKRGKL